MQTTLSISGGYNANYIEHSWRADYHRVRALGNAVVPQIPEFIGRVIMEAENETDYIQHPYGASHS